MDEQHLQHPGGGSPQPHASQQHSQPPYPERAGSPSIAPASRRGVGVVVVALVAGLVGGGVGVAGAYAALVDGGGATPVSTGTVSPAGDGVAAAEPGTVAGAAAIATPSTADIRVSTAQGSAEGSGIVLTPDGDVLTNNHVVSAAGPGRITVTLADGTEYPAEIVGTAPSYDLAVLQLDGASGLTPATFGDSTQLQVGQQVVAIGSPQGLSGTVTSGIVSALSRTVTVQGEDGRAVVYNGLQTDAPINRGNSGGALVDLQGRVIGINSAIATTGQSAGSIGLGFAIPVDQARRVAQEILDTGEATKPALGVEGVPAASDGRGATITSVQDGSPAAAAGLVAGETVTRVGDAPVQDFADLIARIGAATPDGPVTLTVQGDGGERTVEVTLGAIPDEAASDARQPSSQSSPGPPVDGGPVDPFGR